MLTQTLRHGPRESREITLTPQITDAPIILVALVVAVTLAKAIAQSWHKLRPFSLTCPLSAIHLL